MINRMKGAGKLSRKLLTILVLSAMPTLGYASDVYIDQAGDSSIFNITQSSGNNRVGTDGTPSMFSGNNILVDIIQTGTLNAADLQVLTATDTIIDYTATGDGNTLLVEIGNSGNSLTVVKAGDDNRVTMCGTNNGQGTPAGANASCSTDVGVVDTVNVANITGSRNSVNFALASPNASNTVNIGQTLPSNDNVVNITQSGAGVHTTNIGINGDQNKVNITQQN
jgi:hypothetical protein